jgi:ABC-type branched-subunit amino acid transport system substrate-binding protein
MTPLSTARSLWITLALLCVLNQPVGAEPFRIGVSAPLTGELAEYGKAVERGFTLAMERQGNSTPQLVFEDNQYDGRQSVAAYRRLKDMMKVDVLFSWGEPPLHAIAPIVEREHTPTLAMSVDTLPVRNSTWTMLSINPPSDFIATLQKTLRAKGFSRVGFVVTEDPFLQGLYEEFQKSPDRKGEVALVGTVSPAEKDFKAISQKLARSHFDAVGIFLLSGQVSQLYRELEHTKFATPTFGTDVFESPTEIKAAGKGIQQSIYANVKVPKEFKNLYTSRFASESQLAFAYNAYVVGTWLREAFRETPAGVSPDAILAVLAKGPRDEGIPLKRSRENFNYLQFPLVTKQIVGETFEDLE